MEISPCFAGQSVVYFVIICGHDGIGRHARFRWCHLSVGFYCPIIRRVHSLVKAGSPCFYRCGSIVMLRLGSPPRVKIEGNWICGYGGIGRRAGFRWCHLSVSFSVALPAAFILLKFSRDFIAHSVRWNRKLLSRNFRISHLSNFFSYFIINRHPVCFYKRGSRDTLRPGSLAV